MYSWINCKHYKESCKGICLGNCPTYEPIDTLVDTNEIKNNICEYCNKSSVIHLFNFNNVSLELYIEYGELSVNTFNHNASYDYITEDIVGSFKIYYCPMCGRKL